MLLTAAAPCAHGPACSRSCRYCLAFIAVQHVVKACITVCNGLSTAAASHLPERDPGGELELAASCRYLSCCGMPPSPADSVPKSEQLLTPPLQAFSAAVQARDAVARLKDPTVQEERERRLEARSHAQAGGDGAPLRALDGRSPLLEPVAVHRMALLYRSLHLLGPLRRCPL